MKDIQQTLKSILPFVLILAVISPYILINNLFFPFITGKAFFFRMVIEVATLLYIIIALIDKSYRPKISPLTIGVSIFTLILALATVFAVDPLKAFWSNYERMEGFVHFLHLTALFVVAGSALKKKDGWWVWFFNISLIMSVVIGIDAFLSFYSNPNSLGYRIFGNLGNSSYLGVYSLIHIFVAMFFIIKKIGRHSAAVLARDGAYVAITVYGLIALFNLIVLFNTGTRGSFVGLVFGIFVSSVLIAIFEKEQAVLRKLSIVTLTASIAFVLFLGLFKDTAMIKNVDILSRFAQLVTFDIKNVLATQGESRVLLWGTALEGFKERPILGWGLDNFHYVFSAKYNPAMHAQEQWFDRSHNVFMDWLTSAGILGLLSYLSLYVIAITMLWRIRKETLSYSLKALIIGALAAYLGHNLFVFDNLASYILFFAFLAFIHQLYIADKEDSANIGNTAKSDSKPDFAIVVAGSILTVVVFCYVLYVVNLRPWHANATLLNGLRPEIKDAKTGKMVPQTPESKFNNVRKSVEAGVFTSSESIEQLAEKGAELMSSTVAPEIKADAFKFVGETYKSEFIRTPLDPRPYYFYTIFLLRTGMYDSAYDHIQKAIELSPKKQSFLLMKVTLEMQLRKYTEALNTAKTAYEIEPRNKEVKKYYLAALVLNNKAEEAEKLIESPADRIAFIKDNVVITTYVESKQVPRLVAMIREAIKADANNIELRSALINVFVKSADKGNAIKELRALKDIEPSLSTQIDAAITELSK